MNKTLAIVVEDGFPSFITITRSIFSLFTLSVNFLKKAEYNGNRRDENVFIVNCRR